MDDDLIAPCGMNCGICLGHLREKNRCPGCRRMDESEPGHRRKCIIRDCPVLEDRDMRFCSDRCDKYPCRRLRDLDRRYRTKYGMSMIENLDSIGRTGTGDFVRKEKTRWRCRKCGGTLCVHRDSCLRCGEKRQTM